MLTLFCVIQPQGSPLYISTKLAWEKLECQAGPKKKVLSFDSDAGHTLIAVWTYPVVTPPVKHDEECLHRANSCRNVTSRQRATGT